MPTPVTVSAWDEVVSCRRLLRIHIVAHTSTERLAFNSRLHNPENSGLDVQTASENHNSILLLSYAVVGFKRRLHRCQNPRAHGPLPEKNLLTTR